MEKRRSKKVVDLDSVDVNDLVIVREDFISDSDGGEELLRGQRGEIVELDADGDACPAEQARNHMKYHEITKKSMEITSKSKKKNKFQGISRLSKPLLAANF